MGPTGHPENVGGSGEVGHGHDAGRCDAQAEAGGLSLSGNVAQAFQPVRFSFVESTQARMPVPLSQNGFFGTASINRRVYGCCGSRKICSVSPTSTISPSCRIATRWHNELTDSKS